MCDGAQVSVVAVSSLTGTPVTSFHSIVRPTANPILTAFCTQLTGITQTQVNAAPTFIEVWKNLNLMLEALSNADAQGKRPALLFVTCGE